MGHIVRHASNDQLREFLPKLFEVIQSGPLSVDIRKEIEISASVTSKPIRRPVPNLIQINQTLVRHSEQMDFDNSQELQSLSPSHLPRVSISNETTLEDQMFTSRSPPPDIAIEHQALIEDELVEEPNESSSANVVSVPPATVQDQTLLTWSAITNRAEREKSRGNIGRPGTTLEAIYKVVDEDHLLPNNFPPASQRRKRTGGDELCTYCERSFPTQAEHRVHEVRQIRFYYFNIQITISFRFRKLISFASNAWTKIAHSSNNSMTTTSTKFSSLVPCISPILKLPIIATD